MTEATSAAPGSGAPAVAPVADTSPLTITQARDLWRASAPEPSDDKPAPVEREERAPEPKNSGDEPDAAPREDESSGENEAPEPAEKPPVEPPRSWTKEEKEAFKALPPEHQQRIAERERAREVEIRQRQNEIAEHRKAAQAEREAALQEKQRYEQALPQLLSQLQAQAAGEFADVKTWDDVTKLAQEDPLRYTRWQAHHQRAEAVEREVRASQERQSKAQLEAFNQYAAEQDKAALERVPDLAHPERAAKAQAQAVKFLESVGFTSEEMNASWTGQRGISLRDARLQEIVWKASAYDAVKASVKADPPKPAAPVQKPGTTPSRADAGDDRIRELSRQLDKSGSIKDALALFRARKGA